MEFDTCNLIFGLWCLGAALLGGLIGWLLRRPKIMYLTNQLDKKSKDYQDLNVKHNTAIEQYGSLQIAHDEVNARATSLDSSLSLAKGQFGELDTKHTALIAAKTAIDAKLNDRDAQLENTKRQLGDLQKTHESLKAELKGSHQKITDLESQLNKWKTDYNNLKTKSEADLMAANNKYNDLKTQSETDLAAANTRFKDLENNYNSLKTQSEADLSAANAKYDDLQVNYNNLNTDKDNLEAEYAHYKGEVEDDMEATEYRISNILDRFEHLDTDFVAKTSVYNSLQASYKQLDAEMKDDLESESYRAANIQDRFEHLEEDFQTMANKYSALQGEYREATDDIEELETKIVNLQDRYDHLQADHDRDEEIMKGLETDFVNAKQEAADDIEELEAKIANLNDRYEHLDQDYLLTTRNLATVQTNFDNLQIAKQENDVNWLTKYEDLQTAKDTSEAELKTNINGLNNQITDKQATIDTLNVDKDNLNTQVNNLTDDLREATDDIEELEAKIANLNDRYEHLEGDYSSSIENLKTTQNNFANLQTAKEESDTEWTLKWEDLQNAKNNSETELNANISKLNDQIEDKQATIDALNADKDNLNTQIADLNTAKEESDTEWTLKWEDLQNAKNNSETELNANISKLNDQIEDKQATIDALNADKDNLNTQIADLNTAKEESDTEWTLKWEDLQNAKNNSETELNANISKLNDQIEDKTATIGTLNADKDKLNTQIDALNADQQKATHDIQALKGNLTHLNDKYEHLERTYSDTLGKLKTTQTNFANLQIAKEDSETEWSLRWEDLETSKTNMEAELKSNIFSLNDQVTEKQATIDVLHSNRDKLNAQIEDLKTAKEESDTEWALKWEDLDTAKTKAETELNDQIKHLNITVSDTQTNIDSLHTDKANLIAQIESLNATKKENDTEWALKLERLENEKANNETEWKGKVKEAQTNLDALTAQKAVLMKKLQDLKTAKAASENDLQQEINQLQNKLEAARTNLQSLEGEKVALNDKINTQQAALDESKSALKLAAAAKKVSDDNLTQKADKKAEALKRVAAKAKNIDFGTIGIAAASEKDDLQRIKGIGPFLENKLHALGIYTFRQIANFRPQDEDKVNDAIEFFPGRIKRDQWSKQAKIILGLLDDSKKETKPVAKKADKKTEALERVAAKAKNIDFGTIGTAKVSEKDDLQRIKGIGPFLESKLHALGIYTFRQIANFRPEDEDKVNDAIEFFPGRIKRDQWSKQAKILLGMAVKADDLKKVEGIGPKIEQLLNNEGITTWWALSETKVERIQEILDAAGNRYRIHNPATWPAQSKMAAQGKWEELEKWQDELYKGKESK